MAKPQGLVYQGGCRASEGVAHSAFNCMPQLQAPRRTCHIGPVLSCLRVDSRCYKITKTYADGPTCWCHALERPAEAAEGRLVDDFIQRVYVAPPCFATVSTVIRSSYIPQKYWCDAPAAACFR